MRGSARGRGAWTAVANSGMAAQEGWVGGEDGERLTTRRGVGSSPENSFRYLWGSVSASRLAAAAWW
jgi:hypothetical protein